MDRNLLRQLYEKYYAEIYLYLLSLCKQKELAEDLVQETFIKALLSLSESHTNMRSWLYMVARNLYFSSKRKDKHAVLSDFDNHAEELSENPDLLENVIKNENKRLLYMAMQNLSDLKREVLTLQYFVGLPQNQIASLLKLTPENVRILAYRGKKELKKLMEAFNS